MKLPKQTIDVLNNFASINPNLVFNIGNGISTISDAKNIMASAQITETFEQSFGVYDLSEFLSALSLVEDPTLEFSDSYLTIQNQNTSIRYHYSSPEILTTPPTKKITMPSIDVTVTITDELIGKIKRASNALGHSNLAIAGENGKVVLAVMDPKNSTANTYSIILDENNSCKEKFNFIVAISNLKIVPGDYTIEISSKLISHFKHNTLPVEYYIALEKDSTYGE